MTVAPLRIGTRGSELALWQARHVAARLAALGAPAELVVVKTAGDRITDVPLSQVAGKAFFTKELEDALLAREIDLAVHSLKDVATALPEGLALGAVLEREDPRDALVARGAASLAALPAGARVGTSSLRRRAMLARVRPDLELAELRGNVPTRLQRLADGDYDALLLAAAGLVRLGLGAEIRERLPLDAFLPAVAQGAMAIELRAGDARARAAVAPLDHAPTRTATGAERALLARLEGGCSVPVGAHARLEGDELELAASVVSLDGRRAAEARRRGPADAPEALGRALAEELLARGAQEILDQIRGGARA